jgi:S1-C subfamily serine protease
VLGAQLGVDNVERLLALVETVFDEWKQHPVLFIGIMKESADVPLRVKHRAGEPNRLTGVSELSAIRHHMIMGRNHRIIQRFYAYGSLVAGIRRKFCGKILTTLPGGMADTAGLPVQDIVLAIDDRPILGLPDFMAALYLHPAGPGLKIDVLRGMRRISFNIPVKVHHDKLDELSELPDLQKSLLRELSVFVTDLDGSVRSVLASARSESGIVVVAQFAGSRTVDTGLKTGDIIRAIGRTPLQTVSQLQAIVRELKPGDPIVLQVERNGKLQYLAFEMD